MKAEKNQKEKSMEKGPIEEESQARIMLLEDICFSYEGEIALRHVSLTVNKGECIVLEGPNGSGKSTLLRLMNGLIFPEIGTYRFLGREISRKSLKDVRFSKWFHQHMGYVFQNSDVQLFCSSVEEEIAFGPRQMGLSEEEVHRRTEDTIALLELNALRDRAPYHLSGGEKKKTAIACILSMNPDVLVLDEPLAGLDRKTGAWLQEFLRKLRESGKTLVLATHNELLAEALADRILTMNEEHGID